ncbi:efflux RND transporter permease subunit [Brevibacillus choshinensis]|uniref:efflux RND transporter permease subunit n=1 Tax=Brevibacillus choshinensis TaxID=54911 RepID=UPI002E21E1B6|nr:efflux RND transporter permease subunit [Brevibacillus choshinensis]MED4583989.1 efflux RND transporter permease subunit [Brevibacillus choshinensis]
MSNRSFVSIFPALARLLAVVCCLLGIGAVIRMDITTFPDRPVPVYTIHLTVPGLTTGKIDETVTRPVEESVRAVGNALTITSESRPGSASVTVETTERIGSDYKERLEKKLSEVTKQLPVKEWSISQDNLNENRIGFYLLHGNDVQTLSDVAHYTVYEKLISMPGIARVEIDDSSVQKQVDILFRPSMLLAYGLTPGDVLDQLPGDVIDEQMGTVGQNKDQASFLWSSMTEGPQGLGKQLIATDQGYVTLKTLADIRDLRGSKGDEVSVYRGSPAVGITLLAADVGQVPSMRTQAAEAIRELNEAAGGKYRIDLFDDHAGPLAGAVWQFTLLAVLAAVACSVLLYVSQRSVGVSLLSLLAVVMATGCTLGGMWLTGIPLTYTSIGPVIVFSLLYTGAGSALVQRLKRQKGNSFPISLQESWKLLKPLLLGVVILAACWTGLMLTDFLEGRDRIVLYDAWPVLVLGTVALVLVYGFITPVLAGTWLPGLSAQPIRQARRPGKATGYLWKRWERFVKQGYLPYGITLVASLLLVVLLHSFVLVDEYGKLATNDKTLTLEMVQGSSVDDAMRASQIADERLRELAEINDVYTVASKDRLSLHLKLADRYEWTMTLSDLEKELDKRLRDIPGTDPFAFVVSEDMKTRLEFTVKGPSLLTTQGIAQEVLNQLQKYTSRDEDGREIITDERIGEGSEKTIIEIRPKADMLARYRVSEAEIKKQLESYLGEKSAGSVYWNEQSVPVVVRFPDKWMEHPDQVKNILIRTPAGKVHLGDLVHWQVGKVPLVYQREDGLYVFTVSSAVRDAGRIDSLSYVLPLRMQKTMIIPEGYSILNADELKKLKEEQTDKVDWSGRVLVATGLIATVLVASLLLQRRTRDGLLALVILPVLSGAVLVGLLIMDRPMNGMAFYGMMGAGAILLQQALVLLDDMLAAREDGEETSIWDAVRSGFGRALASQWTVFASVLIASLPLAFGWGAGVDPFASFACTLLFGTLLAAFAAIVLVPGIHHATEWSQATKTELTLPIVLDRIRVWWENERVRKQDVRERKHWLKQRKKELLSDKGGSDAQPPKDLSREDFLPLPAQATDANQ